MFRIFSADLAGLVSMSMDFAEICGITETEIRENFEPEVTMLAEEQDLSIDECYE